MKTYHLTIKGKRDLEEELQDLLNSRREISERIADAKSYGDLSENAEYSAAREEQGVNETRIAEIENILKNAEIIKDTKRSKIALGSRVVLSSKKGKVEYQIVGAVEADPLDNKISNESPLGKELIGKKAGEEIELSTPKGNIAYKVEEIL